LSRINSVPGSSLPIFRHIRALRVLSAIILLALLASPVAAQQGSGKASDPGQIQKRIKTPTAPRAPVGEITLPEPGPAPGAAGSAAKFVLVGVEITGSTIYPPAQLSFAYEAFLAKEISLKEVGKILASLTAKYRGDGYILSRAFAPPQNVEGGILRIQIIEGFVEQVEFTGAKPGGARLLRGFADIIKAQRPLRLAALERNLLILADAPGMRVTPALKVLDEGRGAYLLRLNLRHNAIDGFVNLDNRGTTPVGPLQAFAGVNFNSALGWLERTRLTLFTIPNAPEELLYGQIHHEQMLNAHGTRAWFAASRSMVDTGVAGADKFGDTGTKENSFGTRVTIAVSHPFIRSRTVNLTATLRFDALDSDKNSAAANSDYDERLRVVRLGAVLSGKDDFGGTNSVTGQVSKGLNILHATDRNAFHNTSGLSRTNGRSDFFKIKLDLVRRQTLARNLSLRLSASAQKSPHTLLSSEEFSVGGRSFGRAYNPSDISGNQGAAGAMELRFNSPLKPDLMRHIQLYGFYDFGAVWGAGFTRKSLASSGGGVRLGLPWNIFGAVWGAGFTRKSLASSGGGVRLGLPWNISADLEVATPLTRAVTPGESGSGGPRIFFKILKRF